MAFGVGQFIFELNKVTFGDRTQLFNSNLLVNLASLSFTALIAAGRDENPACINRAAQGLRVPVSKQETKSPVSTSPTALTVP